MKYLYEKDPTKINIKDNDGWIGFHWACKYGHIEIVKYLYEKDIKQIPEKVITYDFVNKKFPIAVNVIKNGNKVLGHTFILPTNKKTIIIEASKIYKPFL